MTQIGYIKAKESHAKVRCEWDKGYKVRHLYQNAKKKKISNQLP